MNTDQEFENQVKALTRRRNEVAEELVQAMKLHESILSEIASAVLAGKDATALLRKKATLEETMEAQRAAVAQANDKITNLGTERLKARRGDFEVEYRTLARDMVVKVQKLAGFLHKFAAEINAARDSYMRMKEIGSLYEINPYSFLAPSQAGALDAYKFFLALALERKLEGFKRRFESVDELMRELVEK